MSNRMLVEDLNQPAETSNIELARELLSGLKNFSMLKVSYTSVGCRTFVKDKRDGKEYVISINPNIFMEKK